MDVVVGATVVGATVVEVVGGAAGVSVSVIVIDLIVTGLSGGTPFALGPLRI